MNNLLGVVLLIFLFYGDPDVFDLLRAVLMKYLGGL